MTTAKWALSHQLVEPGRLWIRHVPKAWPAPEEIWTDVSSGRLGEAGRGVAPPAIPGKEGLALKDCLYLPPVRDDAETWRNELAEAFSREGTPLLLQVLPHQAPPALPWRSTVRYLFDPLPRMVEGKTREASLDGLPTGSETVFLWPLIGGLTDASELWERYCEALAARGLEHVHSVSLDLSPAHRRRLAERCEEESYHAVFHRESPSEGAFDAVAQRYSLEPFLPRPATGRGAREESNRHLAGLLSLAGEIWLRLGRSPAKGERLFGASRWIDGTQHDVAALAREGNLGLVPQIQGGSRRLIEEWVKEGHSDFLDELRASYRGEVSGAESMGSESI